MSLAETLVETVSDEPLTTKQQRQKQPALVGKGKLTKAGLPKLTAQQMEFVDAVTEGGISYTEAYLRAYPTAKKWPRPAVWAAASRTAAHDKVAAWLNAAWEAKALATDRSLKGHLSRLENMQYKALSDIEALDKERRAANWKVALEAEKQHAQALGLTREGQTGGVTVNLVSFADQDVSVSTDGKTVTVSQDQKPVDK